jgi:hypothetical protein
MTMRVSIIYYLVRSIFHDVSRLLSLGLFSLQWSLKETHKSVLVDILDAVCALLSGLHIYSIKKR